MKAKFVNEIYYPEEHPEDWNQDINDPQDKEGLGMELSLLFSEAASTGITKEELQEIINKALSKAF